MTLNIGIVGCGYMGGVHTRNLAADPRVKVAGVADVSAERAADLARGLGARAYGTAAELLAAGVDAVYVTTPNTLHTEAVLEALAAGVHVFSEKPMATRFTEAQQIHTAARDAKGIYQVGHNRRFAPVYLFCAEQIRSGFAVSSAHIKMNRGELQNPPWVSNTAITGGFLYESTLHLLDMARFLLGDIVEVECRANRRAYQEIDNFSMLLSFASGVYATFSSCAHTTWAFPFESIELYGAHAQLVTQEMEKVSFSAGLGHDVVTHDYFQLAAPQKWGYVAEDRLFVDSIVEGKPAAVNAEDGFRAIELVEAVYRSAQAGGERVRLPL